MGKYLELRERLNQSGREKDAKSSDSTGSDKSDSGRKETGAAYKRLRSRLDQSDRAGRYNKNYVERTGSYIRVDSTPRRETAKAGLAKYEEDRKAATRAAQEKPWWQKMAEDTVDNEFRLLPGVNVHGIARDFERDTSYQEMDDRWDEEHRQEFGYRYAQDPEDARDYAAGYNDYLNRLEKQQKMEVLGQEAVDKPWLSTAKAIGAQALGGFGEYVNDVAENLGRGRITERGSRLSPTEYAGTVTGAISEDLNRKHGTLNEDIPVFGGKGWGDVYQLGTSAAQSMLSARALGGLGTLVSYFGQAAASSVDDARRRGASDDEALVYGALSGIAEGLAEQINIKQLQSIGSAATMRELMQTMAKQGLSEGIEEGVTSVLNTFADNLVLQDRSLMNIRISEYMAGGMTEEEARRRGWMDSVEDTLFDMFGGFASGGVSGGIQTGINTGVTNLRYGNASLDDMMALVQEGMAAPEGSAARTMAQEYEQQLFHGRELNGVQIQRLLQELDAQEYSGTEQAHDGSPMAESEATDIREEPAAQEVTEEPVATHQNGLQVEEEDVPDTDVGDMEEDVLASLSDLGLHEEEARVLRENFRDSGMDPGEYAIGVRTAFQYGQMGIPARELTRSDSAAGSLAEYQRITAYKYGRLHGQQQAQAEQKNLAGKTVGEHRNVEFDGDWSRLNDAQMAGITAVNALGETLGVRYRFYESYQKGKQRVYLDENGVEKNAPNGFYKDGVIHLDVNAGSNGQGTVLFTAAHEMTHFIREWSPEKFRVLADTLMEGYAGTDTNVEQLINEKIAAYRDSGENLSFEQAFEEVVADSMETMLSDGSFAQRVQKLKQTDRTLWEKIRDWFVSMADSIRKAYENLKPDSREGQLVAEMVDTAEKLKELFAEAAVDAAGNLQRAEKNTADEGGEVKYSLRDVPVPTREELEQKQPVKVVDISRPQTEGSFAQRRKQILANAKKVMARPYRNQDTGAMIFLTDKSYTHAFNNLGEIQLNAAEHLPDLIENAVLTHAEPPAYGSEYTDGVYTFFAAAKAERILPVKLKVKEYSFEGQFLPKNIRDYFGSNPGTYASSYDTVVLEVEEIEESPSGSARDTEKHGIAPGPEELSTVTVAELLGLVKGEAEKYVPKHKTSQEDGVKFSLRDSGEAVVQTEQILTDDAVTVDRDGTRYSLRSMKKDIAEGQMFEDLKTHCGWTPEQTEKLKSDLQGLVEYMMPHRDILDMNESYDREGRKFSPYKPNSDPLYKISMDFSTLCSKRLLTQYVIENLQVREGRPMSAEEQMAIRDMLNEYRKQEKGLQVACAMCYVEAARLKSPKQISRWIEDPEAAMKDYFAKKNPEFRERVASAQAEFKRSRGYSGDTAKKGMKPKDVRELNLIGPRMRSEYRPSDAEQAIISRAVKLPSSTYLTAGNLANLSETEPEIYEAYTTFIRNATRSKSLETDEPYYYGDSRRDNGNGIVVSDTFIENVNRENGMRFSSWSDWRIQHMLDYITAVIDNSVRGAAMHGYTKFPEEVRVLGKTGMMFNMSGVAGTQTGLNPDGSLSFSETESIDVNEAVELREQFPDTAGLQCIGVSDAHITALLRSDIIDYVIPYHTSGLNAGLRRMANIHGWKDYTSTQHAAVYKSIRKEDAADPEHWHEEPVYSEFFVGYDTGMSGIEAMQASAERYKQMCRDRGLKPKFEKFAEEDGYWKLLIDRKMVNQKTGELIRQKPVSPEFDFGEIRNVVDRYVENYDSGLEARALRHITENWDGVPDRIRDLKKQKKAGKAAKTLANQTMAAMPVGTEKMFSLRDPEHQAVQETLQQENEKLRKDVADLKELVKLQRTVTNGTKFTKTSVEAAAGLLMEKAGVNRGKQELAPILERFYEFVAKNEGYDWSDVAAQTQEAVDWLLEHRKKNTGPDDYSREILDKVRSMRIRLNDAQAAEAANLYGSVNEFRKRMMGSVVISKDGTALDEAWQELAALYPGTFSDDAMDGDMPVKLAEIIGSLRRNEAGEAQWRYEQEMLGQELVREVYDSYWQVSNMRTFADVKQKEIDQLKLKHFNQMDKLRTEYREKTQELKDSHTRGVKQVRENRHKSEERRKLLRVANELNRLFKAGTDRQNVKEGMRDTVATALAHAETLFYDTYTEDDMIRRGVVVILTEEESKLLNRAKDILAELDNPPAVIDSGAYQKRDEKLKQQLREVKRGLKDVFARERIRMDGTTASEVLKNLCEAYKQLHNSEYSYIRDAYDEAALEHLTEVLNEFGNVKAKDMTAEQIKAMREAYTMILTTIRRANKAFKSARGQTIEQMGMATVSEVEAAGGSHKDSVKALEEVKNFRWNNLKPVYAFRAIGSETLQNRFDHVRAGEDVWAKDVDEAKRFYREKAEKYRAADWDLEQLHDFHSRNGLKFQLNLQQMMSLYAYSKREQADEHLAKGGFVFDPELSRMEKIRGITVEKAIRDATAYNLGPEELGAVVAALTKEQKAFVDEMQDYLSAAMGAKGNEVSMELYGIKLFKEKHYFPLKSSRLFLQQKTEHAGEVKLKNSGFAKKTTPEAGNPVILSDFMKVWANHVNDMSMYHAFVLPLEDFNRVMNYQNVNTKETDSTSVRAALQNAYGVQAVQYISRLLTDLNGGARVDPTTGFINKMMGKFKKGAVFASMSVVVQQPSAIGRAMAVIDPKHFGGEMIRPRGHKLLWEEVKKYAPVALIKEMGYFDTNMGRSTVDYITAQEYSGLKEKAKAFFSDPDYRDEVLSIAPALADEISWCYIWQSVKRETAAKHPGMEPGSEEFLKQAGNRFTEVIVRTQVYDSVLSRSANMRSKDTGMKMATAFLAEPTTSINMVQDALLQAKRGDRKFARRAIGSVIASQILNACLVSFVYAMRDDDEDESYGEKYMASFVGNVVESMNPLTYLPFVKDIVSIVQGYEVERTDMAVIGDLVNAWRKLGSDKLKPWEKVEQFAGAVAQMFGLPLKNILRDTRAIWQTVANTGSHMKITGSGAKNAAIEGITGSKGSRADRMYQAALDGDTEYVDRLKSLYTDEAAARTAMTDAIRDALEDEDITAEEAMDHLERLTDRTKEESESRVRYWLYKLQDPDGELSEAALTRYHEKVESSGISLDQYAEYLEKLPDQANREETLAVINSMKLTRAQKDALYRAAGYAESKLDEAPWH